MSNDLIRRHEVIDTLEGVDWYHINDKGEMAQGSSSEHESWYKHDDIFKAIEAMPSAEPIHGEWAVEHGVLCGDGIYGDMFHCSRCGWRERDVEGMNFCPNCGAKMGGLDNE